MDHEVHHAVAVARFIAILGNELDIVPVEGSDTPPPNQRWRVVVTVKIVGDNLILGVVPEAL